MVNNSALPGPSNLVRNVIIVLALFGVLGALIWIGWPLFSYMRTGNQEQPQSVTQTIREVITQPRNSIFGTNLAIQTIVGEAERGLDGPPGPSGAPGPAGQDGIIGRDGRQGIDGAAGAAGANGATGATGPAGATGAAGPTGAEGPEGPQGIPGVGSCNTCFDEGGNAYGSIATLGTTDTFGLSFITDNTEQLFIDTAGNVEVTNGDLTITNGTVSIAGLSSAGIVINNSSGDLSTTATIGASYITPDSLNFTEFSDALVLDASTDISVTGTNVLSITNSGTGNSFVVNDAAGDLTPFVITNDGRVTVATAATNSFLTLAAATTGTSSLNLVTSGGTNVAAPASGDMWWNGTNLYFYDGATNRDLLAGSAGGSITVNTGTSGTDFNVSGSPVSLGGAVTLNIPDASTTARGLVTTGSQTFGGAKTFNDALLVNGNTTLGNASSDTVTFNALVASNLSPSADNTYNLGSLTNRWADLFLGPDSLNITSTTGTGGTGSNYTLMNTGFSGGQGIISTTNNGTNTTGNFGGLLFESGINSGQTLNSAISLMASNTLGSADRLLQVGDADQNYMVMTANGAVALTPDIVTAGFDVVSTNSTLSGASGTHNGFHATATIDSTATAGNVRGMRSDITNDSTDFDGFITGLGSAVTNLESISGGINGVVSTILNEGAADTAYITALGGTITLDAGSTTEFMRALALTVTNDGTIAERSGLLAQGIVTNNGTLNGLDARISSMDWTNSATGLVPEYYGLGTSVSNSGTFSQNAYLFYAAATNDADIGESLVGYRAQLNNTDSVGTNITSNLTQINNSGTVTGDLVGYDLEILNAGTADTGYGVRTMLTGDLGTLDSFYGLSIDRADDAAALTTSYYGGFFGIADKGTVNNYGLYLEGASGGSGTNASIWVDGGLTRLGAATTSNASLRITSSAGADPTSPTSGDLWWNGTNLNFRAGGSTVDLLSGGGGGPGSDTTAFHVDGDSFGTPAVLGTNDTFALAFETDGTTRMTISATGAVGIGGSPTTSRLGLGAATTGLSSLNIATSGGTDPSAPASGDLWWNGTNLNFRTAGSTVDLLSGGGGGPGSDTTAFHQNGDSFGALAVLGTNDTFGLAFETDGTTRMTIDEAGLAAIGASPTDAYLSLGAATTGLASLNLESSAATNPSAPNSGDMWWNGTNLYFFDGTTNQDLLVGGSSQWTNETYGINYDQGLVQIGNFDNTAGGFQFLVSSNYSADAQNGGGIHSTVTVTDGTNPATVYGIENAVNYNSTEIATSTMYGNANSLTISQGEVGSAFGITSVVNNNATVDNELFGGLFNVINNSDAFIVEGFRASATNATGSDATGSVRGFTATSGVFGTSTSAFTEGMLAQVTGDGTTTNSVNVMRAFSDYSGTITGSLNVLNIEFSNAATVDTVRGILVNTVSDGAVNNYGLHLAGASGGSGDNYALFVESADSYMVNALRVGTAVNAVAGMIQWTGTDFEGYDGADWVSLTGGGGSSQWTTSGSEIYYNGGPVGIGTSNPNDYANLHLAATDDPVLILEDVGDGVGYAAQDGSTGAVFGSEQSVLFKTGIDFGAGPVASGNTRLTLTNAGTSTFSHEVVVGNSAADTAGAIRWTGTDFEGYDGVDWVSFTAGGGGGTDPNAFHDGGDSFGALASLGTLDNFGLEIQTNGTLAATFTTTSQMLVGADGTNYYDSALQVYSEALDGDFAPIAHFINFNEAQDAGITITTGQITPDSTNYLMSFENGNQIEVGSITFDGTGTQFNTTSDERLKTNIEATAITLDTLMNIQVVDYNWKTNPDGTRVHGFVAQDLYQVYPQAVTKPNKEEGTWSVDYSKLMPVAIKSLQEQQLQIENLQAQINGTTPLSAGADIPDEGTIAQIVTWTEDTWNFIGEVVFEKPVQFLANVRFLDRVTFSDEDMAGQVTIEAGQDNAQVTFETPFEETPAVNLTPQGQAVPVAVDELSTTGFKVKLGAPLTEPLTVLWTSLSVKN